MDTLEWLEATKRARAAAARKEHELLAALGFKIERLDNLTMLMRGGERRTALAVLLDPAEIPEAGTARFNNLSPVSYALAKADAGNLSWVVVLQGDRLRLYPTAVGVGVGRRGRGAAIVSVVTTAEVYSGSCNRICSACRTCSRATRSASAGLRSRIARMICKCCRWAVSILPGRTKVE